MKPTVGSKLSEITMVSEKTNGKVGVHKMTRISDCRKCLVSKKVVRTVGGKL